MTMYYELVNRNEIKPAPRPLRIDGKDIFTTDEAIYNEYGYYRLEKEPYPVDEMYYYAPYYELIDNVIYQKWEQGNLIEEEQSDAD